jgi:predicted aspartyl protease
MHSVKCGFYDIPGGQSAVDLLVQWGPTILVNIGFDPKFTVGSTESIPIPGITDLNALVDTGATESCIDSLLAAQLNLPVVDRRMTAGAHGAKEVNVHLAQVRVPSLGFTIYGAFAGVDLRAGGQAHSALLGRTFLKHFKMNYEGMTGTVEIIDPNNP